MVQPHRLRATTVAALPFLLLMAAFAQTASSNADSRAKVASLQRRAEAGDAEAQTNLGLAYRDGKGVARDDWKAAEWFRKAAEHGNAIAQNALGIQYLSGRGVAKDLEQAFQWYKKSAAQKYAPGVFNTAISYYNGDGVPENMVTAYAWMLFADELGEEAGHDAAQRTALELAGRAVEGELKLAEMLEAGAELPKDEAAAARWYRLAADHGSPDAEAKYGMMLVQGRGIAPNPAEAFQWFQKAAEQKSGPAMFSLGYAFQKGTLGQQVDMKKAIGWYERAAAAGHPGAMVNLGAMYSDGTAGNKDLEKAYGWFYMADAFNIPQAKTGIGVVKPQLSAKQITRAEQSVAEWWRKNGAAIMVRRRHEVSETETPK